MGSVTNKKQSQFQNSFSFIFCMHFILFEFSRRTVLNIRKDNKGEHEKISASQPEPCINHIKHEKNAFKLTLFSNNTSFCELYSFYQVLWVPLQIKKSQFQNSFSFIFLYALYFICV